MTDQRAINTVVDVAFALLFVAAAVGVLATVPIQNEDEHEPLEADQTADVIGGSTISVNYSIGALAASASDGGVSDYDETELTRITHGSTASHVGDIAISRVAFGEGGDSERLVPAETEFEDELDEQLQTNLVESSFEANVTAVWEPFEGASIHGDAAVGQTPPSEDTVSASTLTVSSGIEPVREDAIQAVEDNDEYDVVADLVASALIEGYLPELESKHALERSGLERALVAYRYERMATVIDDADPEDSEITENIRRESADPETANEYLADHLADALETELAATFDSAHDAAEAISVGEVTIIVRTWEP